MSLTLAFVKQNLGWFITMNQKKKNIGKLSNCFWLLQGIADGALAPGSFVFCIRFFSYQKIKTMASGYHSTYYWLKSLPEDLPSPFQRGMI